MGMRGIGAKPKAVREAAFATARKRLPWQRKGLNRAGRVIAFCQDLPITQGKLAGKKMKLRPWQIEFIQAVYAVDARGGRPVRTAVLSMARKNGKTQLATALALCHLLGPEAEPRGEVYSAANDVQQAGRLFSEIVAILNAHPELDARVNVIRFRKEIEVLSGDGAGSVFKALSSDAGTKHGLSPSMTVYDELGQAPKRDLFEALDTAMGGRENPLMVVISTQAASDFAPMSELIDYGLRVRSGDIVDPSFHLTLYAAPADADPWALATWQAANPALGDFRSLDDVERQAAQAQSVASKENAFRNLILNQRVEAHSRFIARAEWEACNGAPDFDAMTGRPCYGGLDLSASRDLTALVLCFPNDDGKIDILCRFFLPEDGLREKAELDRVPYDTWAKQGFLTLMPGKTVDPAFVAHSLIEAAATFDLRKIAFDRWRIEDLKRELAVEGATLPLEPFGQGFRDMAPAIDRLERAVAERQLRHGDNPIMNWCAANAVVTQDPAGNRKLDKAKAAGRIDGLVALAMALGVTGREDDGAMPACLAELMLPSPT